MTETISNFRNQHWFLSNFSPSVLAWRGRTWATVEHAFQAAKTTDPAWIDAIAHASTPAAAKALGRQVPLREGWDAARDGVMLELLQVKFSEPSLRERLNATAPAHLVEGNTWHDLYWGRCVCNRCADRPWHNRLGKLLMAVRG